MYRTLLLVLLSTHAALGAPQESRESSITYLKIQAPTTDKPIDNPNYRSYDFVPNKSKKSNKNRSNPIVSDDKEDIDKPETDTKLSEVSDLEINPTEKYDGNTDFPEISADNHPVTDSSPTDENVENTHNEPTIELIESLPEKNKTNEEKGHKNLLKDTFENLDNDTLEPGQVDRHSRDYDYTTTINDSNESEISDYSTEKYDNLDKKVSKISPKLTYFQKYGGSFSHNLIESSGKRRFRSRCRCEKIWNCPKLQITVPRCPEEYFMCCF